MRVLHTFLLNERLGDRLSFRGDSGRYCGSLFWPTEIPFNNTLSSLLKIN